MVYHDKVLFSVVGATVALALLLSVAWFFRWERLHGSAAGVFLLDRWSGEVYLATPRMRMRVPDEDEYVRSRMPQSAEEFLNEK